MTDSREMALDEVLGNLGRDPRARERLVSACRDIEAMGMASRTAVREELTGPIVDALHRHAGVVHKELSNGLSLAFLYRSKIARDFVLSDRDKPDHVWEPQTTRLLLELARDATHVVVGGAYFGDQAVLLARAIAGHGGVCHAFEPDREQAAQLSRNAEDNHLTNLCVEACALWSDDSPRLRLDGEDAYGSSSPAAADGGDTVPATTLDAYLDRAGAERVDLIVLDIEGAELAALRGARRRLEEPAGHAPNVVFEVHREYVDWSDGLENTEIVRHLDACGYRSYAIRDIQSNRDLNGSPVELVPPETAYLDGPPHGFNMVAVKEPAALDAAGVVFSPGVSPKLLVDGDPALHHPTGGM
jgi:FkbM family methyltransferase